MADYDSSLKSLEDHVKIRNQLIKYGSRYVGIDKMINFCITDLLQQQSFGSKAGEYIGRLTTVNQQLGSFASAELHQLIQQQQLVHQQEQILIEAKQRADTKKALSPKKASQPTTQQQTKPNKNVHFEWDDFHPPTFLANLDEPYPFPEPAVPTAQPPTSYQLNHSTNAPQATPTALPNPPKTPPPTPPPLYISIYSITTGGKSFSNKLPTTPFTLKIGNSTNDRYSGFTHWLLTDPQKIGVVMWSSESTLVLVQSFDYIQRTAGDTLHIHTQGKDDTRNLATYIAVFFASASTKVFEVN
ncbi:MAG: hypothetical protein L6R40_008564, partial [Gallowayella cf. fulva]